ncbi:MAG: ABC transporter permease, partial [Armatimonadota bacterium]|nr:ABC transporter permease [Armatimonadota bacterium]
MTGAAARQTLRAVRVDARSLAAAGILVAGWEFLPRRGLLNPAYFPPASQVAAALAEGLAAGELLPHVAATVSRLLVAFFLAALPGLGVGVAMGLS